MSELCCVEDLVAAEAQGRRLDYLYFWGHQPLPSGEVGPSCLSQWWESPFTVEGVSYRSAEHWMMAHKARLFDDEAAFAQIIDAQHPIDAKALERKIRGFDEDAWAARRFHIVTEGNVAKFSQNHAVKSYLIDTGARVLVEASPHDRVWGIGLAAGDDRARLASRWRGLNLLGFALMAARAQLASLGSVPQAPPDHSRLLTK